MRNKIEKTLNGYRGSNTLGGKVDQVFSAFTAKVCVICGKTITRKMQKNRMETFPQFRKRKTCGKEKGKYTSCFKRIIGIVSTGEKNGNYVGTMHKKCLDCGGNLNGRNPHTRICKGCYLRKLIESQRKKKETNPHILQQRKIRKKLYLKAWRLRHKK